MNNLSGTLKFPRWLVWLIILIFGLAIIGESLAQRRGGWGGGGGYRSTPSYGGGGGYRPSPPRPMTPAPRPMMPSMAPAPRGPVAMPSTRPSGGTAALLNSTSIRTLPPKLATAPIAQVSSYTGRVTIKGAPIVVTKMGTPYSVPGKGVFSTKTVSTFRHVRTERTRYFSDGRVSKLQTRIAEIVNQSTITTKKSNPLSDNNQNSEKTAKTLRKTPGTATSVNSKTVLIDGQWLRGSHGSMGLFPRQVAEKMKGENFKNFDQFRRSFWKNVSRTPELASQFKKEDLDLMKQGKAPLAPSEQTLGGQKTYILHHKTPINQGGGVYDMDNIVIVTPRYHVDTLEKGIHYGR